MNTNHIVASFDSWLKEEGIEIQDEKVKEILNAYKKLYSDNFTDVGDLPSKILYKNENGDWIELRKKESEVEE